MKDVRVRVIRSHISGPGQVAEVGDELVLPEHVATLRINTGMCELVPLPPPAAAPVEAPAAAPPVPAAPTPSDNAAVAASAPEGAAAPAPGTDAGITTTDVTSAQGAPAPGPEGSPDPNDNTQPAAGAPAQAAAPDASTTTAAPAGPDRPAAGRRGNRP